jgi:predicted RNA-binding Zn ribbon-like protein
MQQVTTPAPGSLERVRDFVNTWDIEVGHDSLSTPQDLVTWLMDAELMTAPAAVGTKDLANAVAVREALREALVANHARAPLPPDAVAVLNAAAVRAKLGLELTDQAQWLARPAASGVHGAIGQLLAIVSEAMALGNWARLKVCVNDTCRWAFYDESRARSGKWCSMQVCGNRAKQQAWRARHTDS